MNTQVFLEVEDILEELALVRVHIPNLSGN